MRQLHRTPPFAAIARFACPGAILMLLLLHTVQAGSRPVYGGRLRVQMRGVVGDFNPAVAVTAGEAKSGLLPLIFEGLVAEDEDGTIIPKLATEWRIAQRGQRLIFRLRPGVKFHDGSTVTGTSVVNSLRSLEPRYRLETRGSELLIQAEDGSATELLRQLADPRYSVTLATGADVSAGTGPFALAGWEPGRRTVLRAFEQYWGGRPFIDEVEIRMGRSERDQMIDLQLKRADLIEIPITETRKTAASIRLPVSEPIDLIAIVFRNSRGDHDPLVRAIDSSVDRASIHQLAHRQGSPTGALLPQWLTGYAFLFPVKRDLGLARRLLGTVPQKPGGLTLGYPSSDAFLRSVTERLVLDLREAGLGVRPVAAPPPPGNPLPDGVLLKIRLQPDVAESLELLSRHTGQQEQVRVGLSTARDPEDLFRIESAMLASSRIVPLLHLPITFALGERVRYGKLEDVFRFGRWHFEDIWVEPTDGGGSRTMTFRTRLLIAVASAVATASVIGTWILLTTTRGVLEDLDEQRRLAIVAQFRREFKSRGDEVVRRTTEIARQDSVTRIAIDLNQEEPDFSLYVNSAEEFARSQALDFLEIVSSDGRIISSAQWPARFGYKHPSFDLVRSLGKGAVFLDRQELPDGMGLGLFSVAQATAGDKAVFVTGGLKLDERFLSSLALPSGVHLYLHLEAGTPEYQASLIDTAGPSRPRSYLLGVVDEVRRHKRETARIVSDETGHQYAVHGIPLSGADSRLLGTLLVASSRAELARITNFIRTAGALAAAGGILLGVLLGWWVTRNISRPVQKLVAGAQKVASGNWDTRVYLFSDDEIGKLAKAFNQMTSQLLDQRERLVQAERVAAWRELARRLAHELKNPLFPLQITVENMQRARIACPDQFDEVFDESSRAILAELGNLKNIISRFSDFAKMPQPEIQAIDVNEIARDTLGLFDSQFARPDHPVSCEARLDGSVGAVRADPEQIRRVLQNLILNALDAMPQGGKLEVETRDDGDGVILEVADSGVGLTQEETGTDLHSLLHDQAARDRARACHRAVDCQ